jgi:hypothetical protein
MSSGVEWNHSSCRNHETPKRNTSESLEQDDLRLIYEKYLLASCMFFVLEYSGKLFKQNNFEHQALFTDILLFGLNKESFMLSGRKVLLSTMISNE